MEFAVYLIVFAFTYLISYNGWKFIDSVRQNRKKNIQAAKEKLALESRMLHEDFPQIMFWEKGDRVSYNEYNYDTQYTYLGVLNNKAVVKDSRGVEELSASDLNSGYWNNKKASKAYDVHIISEMELKISEDGYNEYLAEMREVNSKFLLLANNDAQNFVEEAKEAVKPRRKTPKTKNGVTWSTRTQ